MLHFLGVFYLPPAWSELNTACVWEKLQNISRIRINNKQNVDENTFLVVVISSFLSFNWFRGKITDRFLLFRAQFVCLCKFRSLSRCSTDWLSELWSREWSRERNEGWQKNKEPEVSPFTVFHEELATQTGSGSKRKKCRVQPKNSLPAVSTDTQEKFHVSVTLKTKTDL